MALLVNENFDGVTAPAMPSDVIVAGSGVITSTIVALSGTNSINAGTNPNIVVASQAADNSNGNCTVTASIYLSGTITVSDCGVVICVGAPKVYADANDNSYWLYPAFASGNGLVLAKMTSGTYGNLVLTPATTWQTGVWYTLTMTRNGSTLFCACQRQSDLNWFTSSATWQSDYVLAIQYTDPSPLPASGSYGGIRFQGLGGGGTAYADNLFVRDQAVNIPHGPIKGVDITPGFGPAGWSPNATTGWFTQIDLAKSIGCNAVRCQSFLPSVYQGGATLSQIMPQVLSVIAYAKKKGMWVLLSEDENAPYGTLHTWAEASAQMIADRVTIAQAIAGYPNVLGFDMLNEIDLNSTWNMYAGTPSVAGTLTVTTAQVVSFMGRAVSAIKAVAPNLPISASFSSGSPLFTQPLYANISYLCDFMDNHVYSTPSGSASNIYTYVGTSGKPILAGETGGTSSENASTINTRIQALWTNVVQASYPGQPGFVGAFFWTLMPPSLSSLTLFPGSIPETLDSTFGTTWAGFSAPSFFFGSNFRRRRR